MVTMIYVIILVLGLGQQLAFSILYWRWIPEWRKNAYGRLAQFESWSSVALLSALLFILLFGTSLNFQTEDKREILAVVLIPFVFLGALKLSLLKRAVDSAKAKQEADDVA